jgi:glycerate kinase
MSCPANNIPNLDDCGCIDLQTSINTNTVMSLFMGAVGIKLGVQISLIPGAGAATGIAVGVVMGGGSLIFGFTAWRQQSYLGIVYK